MHFSDALSQIRNTHNSKWNIFYLLSLTLSLSLTSRSRCIFHSFHSFVRFHAHRFFCDRKIPHFVKIIIMFIQFIHESGRIVSNICSELRTCEASVRMCAKTRGPSDCFVPIISIPNIFLRRTSVKYTGQSHWSLAWVRFFTLIFFTNVNIQCIVFVMLLLLLLLLVLVCVARFWSYRMCQKAPDRIRIFRNLHHLELHSLNYCYRLLDIQTRCWMVSFTAV